MARCSGTFSSETGAGEAPAANRCPLCGQPNGCALEAGRETGAAQAPCWCTQAVFDDSLLARLPAQARGKACICAACARSGPPSV